MNNNPCWPVFLNCSVCFRAFFSESRLTLRIFEIIFTHFVCSKTLFLCENTTFLPFQTSPHSLFPTMSPARSVWDQGSIWVWESSYFVYLCGIAGQEPDLFGLLEKLYSRFLCVHLNRPRIFSQCREIMRKRASHCCFKTWKIRWFLCIFVSGASPFF